MRRRRSVLLRPVSLAVTLACGVTRLAVGHRPGSDLFIACNEQRGSDASLWGFDNRTAVVKLTYLARL